MDGGRSGAAEACQEVTSRPAGRYRGPRFGCFAIVAWSSVSPELAAPAPERCSAPRPPAILCGGGCFPEGRRLSWTLRNYEASAGYYSGSWSTPSVRRFCVVSR